jgi:hypothetical protein
VFILSTTLSKLDFCWWPVMVEGESNVCHNCPWGNGVLPKKAPGREG